MKGKPFGLFLLTFMAVHSAIITQPSTKSHLTAETTQVTLPALTDFKSAFSALALPPSNSINGDGNLLGGQKNQVSGDKNKLLGNGNILIGNINAVKGN